MGFFQSVPKILNVAEAGLEMYKLGRRARGGTAPTPGEAIDLLLGFGDAIHPGARELAKKAMTLAGNAGPIILGADVIEGEYRELGGPPWADFQRHYRAMPWGTILIVGDPGEGKSEFGKKSLWTWHQRDPWPCEWVNWYGPDLPDFGYEVPPDRIIKRIRKVMRYVAQAKGQPIDDGLDDDDLADKHKRSEFDRPISQGEIDRMGYRNVAIDEAGLFFSSLGKLGQQDSREAAKRWSDQIRHLNTRMLLIAQKLSDIPPHVRANALHIFKKASPGLIEEDYKPGTKRVTSRKWEEALMAIEAIRTGIIPEFPTWMNETQRAAITTAARAHAEWWPVYRDDRGLPSTAAWGYAVGGLGGHSIRTIFPFKRYQPREANNAQA